MNLDEFIRTQITSLAELRTLLLLHGRLDVDLDALEIALELNMEPAKAVGALTGLVSKGLLASAGNPPRYHYQPQSAAQADCVRQLAEMDRSQPVTLINLIAPVQMTPPRLASLSSSPSSPGNS